MSHDLKAPLNAILGFAELVSRGVLTEGQRESVTIIEQRGRELLHLIDTILDAARVEAGELTVSPEWTRVGDVVMPAVMDAQELTGGTNIPIVGEIQPGVPRVLVDPVRLTQALKAIILAASRFAERGRIVVRATIPAAGEQVRIDVEVSGRSTSAADRERIFDAFKHSEGARRHGEASGWARRWRARSSSCTAGGSISSRPRRAERSSRSGCRASAGLRARRLARLAVCERLRPREEPDRVATIEGNDARPLARAEPGARRVRHRHMQRSEPRAHGKRRPGRDRCPGDRAAPGTASGARVTESCSV